MTMTKMLGRGTAAIAVILLAGACGSDPAGLAPDVEAEVLQDAQINLDVARYAADVTVDDIQLMTGEADLVLRGGFGMAEAGCVKKQNKRFHCDKRWFGWGNVSYTRQVTFYDSEGAEMDYYDREDTDSVNIYVSMSGDRANEKMSMQVSRERDLYVSGLYGEETTRTWNGWGKSSRNRTRVIDEAGTRTYDMTDTTTVTGVILPVPRYSDWPQEGTIERTVDVEKVDELGDPTTRTCNVVVEFNGTRYVPITVNGEEFTLDLKRRKIVEDTESADG
jgi:hypothetical protein